MRLLRTASPDDLSRPATDLLVSTTAFGGLTVAGDARALEPRPWTLAQSHWAAELAADASPGPVLELCAGVGHIGLETARLTRRLLVQVEQSVDACEWAQYNAVRNKLADRVDLRIGAMGDVLAPDERFPIIIADPPYVPTAEVDEFPDDPRTAIDGGHDGMDLLRESLSVIARHLLPQGVAILQVRGYRQAAQVKDELLGHGPDLVVPSIRSYGHTRALVLLRPGFVL